MHVIDVRKGDERVQRLSIEAGARIEVEGAGGQVTPHLILLGLAAIDRLRCAVLHIERGEAVGFMVPTSPPEPLTHKTSDVLGRERVAAASPFGRGIAAAVIGDALVRAEQVRR